jgi:hypothetical protein
MAKKITFFDEDEFEEDDIDSTAEEANSIEKNSSQGKSAGKNSRTSKSTASAAKAKPKKAAARVMRDQTIRLPEHKAHLMEWVISFCIILVLAVSGIGWYMLTNKKTDEKTPAATQKSATDILISKIGEKISLPTGETPQIIDIDSPESLSGDPFFDKSAAGDKALIYTESGFAVLFRPSTEEVVNSTKNIAALSDSSSSLDSSGNSSSQTGSTTEPKTAPRITFLNATSVNGLATLTENTLKTSKIDFTTSTKGNAVNKASSGTIVVDLSGKFAKTSSEIAGILSGKVATSLPSGESSSLKDSADIVIFIAK